MAGFDWQNVHFFAGVRLWVSQWDVPHIEVRPTAVGTFDLVTVTSASSTELVPMPTLGVSAGKWLLSATFAPSTSYDCRCSAGEVDRHEFDVNLGYEVLPRLYLSVGYKDAKQNKLADLPSSSAVKVKALLIGANASAPLTDTLSLYGNAAYGFSRQRSDLGDPEGHSRYDGGYQIGEVGLTWRFGPLLGATWQNTSLALGYRFQSLLVRDLPVAEVLTPDIAATPVSVRRSDVRTNTSGPVVTLIAFF
jgi:hypothetical protein